MSKIYDGFIKRKDYLFCIDSDGCVMNTMDIKHIRCFGPCMVEEWELFEWEEPILKRWNEINLYTITRGINRFKALAKILREINTKYCVIDDLEMLEKWVNESFELSNAALERAIAMSGSSCLKKVFSWSLKVNEMIQNLSLDEKEPFSRVRASLEYAHIVGDVAVISSANRQAVMQEWEKYGLLDYVDIVLTQDNGSKAHCIQELLKKGYDKEHVIMVGDAPGDQEAAKRNDVYFYPILVGHEEESWKEFNDLAIGRLCDRTYGGSYQIKKEAEFMNNLK